MKTFFSFSRRPSGSDTPLTYEESLRLDLKLAKWELENAYAGFDYATDPDLIDCYIYKLNAAMKRYKFLLEKYSALKKEVLLPEANETSPKLSQIQDGALTLLT